MPPQYSILVPLYTCLPHQNSMWCRQIKNNQQRVHANTDQNQSHNIREERVIYCMINRRQHMKSSIDQRTGYRYLVARTFTDSFGWFRQKNRKPDFSYSVGTQTPPYSEATVTKSSHHFIAAKINLGSIALLHPTPPLPPLPCPKIPSSPPVALSLRCMRYDHRHLGLLKVESGVSIAALIRCPIQVAEVCRKCSVNRWRPTPTPPRASLPSLIV